MFPIPGKRGYRMLNRAELLGLPELLRGARCHTPDKPWHALQHTFAAHAVMSGIPLYTVKELLAVGRKNWMFAGSDEGARRAAIIYSLVASCCLHGVDPFGYLRDVLERIGTHPARRIQELLPKAWADNAKQVNTQQAALT